MGRRIRAVVEGSVLSWARESAGYSISDIAESLGKKPEEIRSWEVDEVRPYMGQVRRLANLYKRPISDFYLPAPPEESPLPHDFRRSPGTVAGVLTPELRRQLRFARERRELVTYLRAETGDPLPSFHERVSLDMSPEIVGERIRDLLAVSMNEQSRWQDGYGALRAWRQRIEALDILVFQFDGVDIAEVWGFSIAECVYPVIGINKALAPNGRTFTMLHEFVHLLLGEGGICDIDDYTERDTRELEVEAFCNHAAASALMPSEAFLSQTSIVSRGREPSLDWEDQEIRVLARFFGVSREAVVRRLLTFGLTTREFYREKRAVYQQQYQANRTRQREKLKNGDFRGQSRAQRALSDFGGNFVRLVLDSFGEGRITLADAAQYLEVRTHRIPKVRELAMRG